VQTEIAMRCAQEQLLSQQAELRESEARLSAVLEALPDIWFVLDENNHYVDGHEAHPLLIRPIEELRQHAIGYELPTDVAQLQQAALEHSETAASPNAWSTTCAPTMASCAISKLGWWPWAKSRPCS